MALNDLVIDLREALEPHLVARARAEWRLGMGLPGEAAPSPRTSPFGREESFHAVREARESASPRAQPRLLSLLRLCADALEARLGADAMDARSRAEREGRLGGEHAGLSLFEARWRLSREPLRERRAALEQALAGFEETHRGLALRLFDAAGLGAERLGRSGYLALRDAVTGFSHAEWAAQAEALERETAEGYRDLLAYALGRIATGVRPLPRGEAQRHDVLHAARAPWLASHLTREDLLPALQRWTGELGLDWTADKRIRVSLDEGPPEASPFAVALAVPDEVRLSVRREGGLPGWGSLLAAVGDAQARARTDAHAPPEDRWLGDGAVRRTWALLFEQLLLEPRWLMRYARLTSHQAREVARFAAFAQLVQARWQAVRLSFTVATHARGSTAGLEDAWAERSREALWAHAPRGGAGSALSPRLEAAEGLRALALVQPLHRQLQERFDEDWWRNPAAGSHLAGLFLRGGRDGAEALATEWGAAPLALAPAASRLLRCMSA